MSKHLKRYVYIICEKVDGMPSFRHAFIKATDEDHAYTVGSRTVRQPSGNGINDYVIEIPEEQWALDAMNATD